MTEREKSQTDFRLPYLYSDLSPERVGILFCQEGGAISKQDWWLARLTSTVEEDENPIYVALE